jgi:DNA-binding NarL/FixJ family response regulator
MPATSAVKLRKVERGPAAGYEIVCHGPDLLSALVAAWVELVAPGRPVQGIEAPRKTPSAEVVLANTATGRRLAIFATSPDRDAIASQLADGVSSLIAIDASAEELDLALKSLDHGPAFVSSSLVHVLANLPSRSNGSQGQGGPLSARERDVVLRAAAGLSNREIAEELYLSPNTVRSHLQSASSKLGVSSRAKIAQRAHQLGLI